MKKYLTLFITVLILNLSLGVSVFAKTNTSKEAKLTENVKTSITKFGTGKDAKVKVKLKDGTKLKGYVSQINADGFVVMNEKNNTATEVSYKNAKQVKGNNLSTGVKIVIGVGILIAVVIVLAYILPSPE